MFTMPADTQAPSCQRSQRVTELSYYSYLSEGI